MTAGRSAEPVSVEVLHAPGELPPDALRLLAASEHDSPQCGVDWFSLLSEHVFAGTGQTAWLVLREGGVCHAVWPIRTDDTPGALSNYYTSLYTPAHSPDASAAGLAQMARTLRRLRHGKGEWLFTPMDPESAAYAAMEQALRAAGLKTFRYYRFGNRYLPCEGMTWTKYFAERKGAMRNTVRRMGKKLGAEGGTLELITGGERLEVGIAAFEQVYAASWKQAEPYPNFIRGLMLTAARNGWLRLGVAWLNGQAIAAQLWLVAHGRAEIFKLAYDEAFKAYTAGTLLSAMLMEHVLDKDKVREVDFLTGDDPYKKNWMSHRRERWGLAAYDPLRLAGMVGIARSVGGRLRRRWMPAKPGAGVGPTTDTHSSTRAPES